MDSVRALFEQPISTPLTPGGGERIWQDYRLLLLIPYVLLQRPARWVFKTLQLYERNKELCKLVMGGYNVSMSFFSFVMFLTTVHCVRNLIPGPTLWDVGHFDGSGGGHQLYQPYMAPYVGQSKTLYDLAQWLFYLSKYVEFLDTYFLILCDRPVSWLQWYHHVGAPVIMALNYWSKCDAAWIFVLLNGFIHTIMYFYYAAAIWKWRVPGFIKPTITSLQIAQFFTGFALLYVYMQNPDIAGDWWKMCAAWANYAYVGVLVLLFAEFYWQSYLSGKNKRHEAKQAKSA